MPMYGLTSPSQYPVVSLIGSEGTPLNFNPAYLTPTFLNSWVNLGSGFEGAKYFKDSSGIVQLCGMISTGFATLDAFVLPVGYRPLNKHRFIVVSNGAIGYVDVLATGAVNMTSVNNAWVSLDSIQFKAEQ